MTPCNECDASTNETCEDCGADVCVECLESGAHDCDDGPEDEYSSWDRAEDEPIVGRFYDGR